MISDAPFALARLKKGKLLVAHAKDRDRRRCFLGYIAVSEQSDMGLESFPVSFAAHSSSKTLKFVAKIRQVLWPSTRAKPEDAMLVPIAGPVQRQHSPFETGLLLPLINQ